MSIKKGPRASEELLGRLHEAIGEHLLSRLLSGEATPGEVAASIKFLKDNRVEKEDDVETEEERLEKLKSSLPTFEDYEDDDD